MRLDAPCQLKNSRANQVADVVDISGTSSQAFLAPQMKYRIGTRSPPGMDFLR